MEQKEYRLAAVMFTDIVGFSRMMERDESGTLALVSEHNSLITDLAIEHGGTVIKTVGDAFLLDFPNTVQAVKCALAVLDAIERMSTGSRGERIRLRIGIHLGDIYFYENDALGEGINIASRLQSQAEPDTICVSQEVYNLVYNKLDESTVVFRDLGEHNLKNISRTLRVYQVRRRRKSDGVSERSRQEADEATGATGAGRPGANESGDGSATDDYVVPGAATVRDRVMEIIQKRGRRPSRSEAITELGLISASEIRELDDMVARGFVRRSSDPADGVRSGSEGRRGGAGVDFTIGKSRAGTYEENSNFGEEEDDDDWGSDEWGSSSSTHSSAKVDLPSGKLGRLLRKSRLPDHDLYDAYREEFAKRMRGERAGLTGHTASFIGVNAMLVLIWSLAGGGFPWFLFPLLGWGIGYMSHRTATTAREQEFAEVEAMQSPTREHLRLHRRLWKSIRGWRGHLTSNLWTIGLLATINIITSPGFAWALIPAGFMGIGIITHRISHRRERQELEEQLAQSGLVIDRSRMGGRTRNVTGTSETSGGDAAAQARSIREEIVRQMEALPEVTSSLGHDFQDVLDRYVEQIETLTVTRSEVNELLASIPVAELDQEHRRLQNHIADTADDRIAAEYRRNLEQVERQRRSYSELTAESEMLRLRTTTAVNALKQLKIDVARTRSSSQRAAGDAVEDLRSRSRELSEYLEDLRAGYDEIE